SDEGKQLNRRVEIKLLGNDKQYVSTKLSEPAPAQKISLLNNAPNPFAGSTTINAYVDPEVKEARVNIIDINGKLIKAVYLVERGNASFTFEAGNLPAGIYMATLLSDGKADGTIKMILQQ